MENFLVTNQMPEENLSQSKSAIGVKLGHCPGKYSCPETETARRVASSTAEDLMLSLARTQ